MAALHRSGTGIAAVTGLGWWSRSLAGVLPDQFAGGVYHAIFGTVVQAGIAALMSVPLGIMAAIYLVDMARNLRQKVTTFMVDISPVCPSIVAALFCLCAVDFDAGVPAECLRSVAGTGAADVCRSWCATPKRCSSWSPTNCARASYALGIPKWKPSCRVVVPTALPGMISGLLWRWPG